MNYPRLTDADLFVRCRTLANIVWRGTNATVEPFDDGVVPAGVRVSANKVTVERIYPTHVLIEVGNASTRQALEAIYAALRLLAGDNPGLEWQL